MNAERRMMNDGGTGRQGMRPPFSAWRSARIVSVAVLLAVVAAPGCAKKEPRYPADFARYQRIDKAVDALRHAYEKKDESAFHGLLLPSLNTDKLEGQVIRDFEQYQDITLDLTIERIVIDGEQVDVFVHWQGLWKKAQGDTEQRERGHGMLRWIGTQSILLAGTDGDVPFGISTRRPEPAPPAPQGAAPK